MNPLVFNSAADFTANPVVIPPGQLVTVTDCNGNVQSHRLTSSVIAQTADSYATTFADPYYADKFPLTVTFQADPNFTHVDPAATC